MEKCECGAAKIGLGPGSGHSSWCPLYKHDNKNGIVEPYSEINTSDEPSDKPILTPEQLAVYPPPGPPFPFIVDQRSASASECYWCKRSIEPSYTKDVSGRRVRYAQCGHFLWFEAIRDLKHAGERFLNAEEYDQYLTAVDDRSRKWMCVCGDPIDVHFEGCCSKGNGNEFFRFVQYDAKAPEQSVGVGHGLKLESERMCACGVDQYVELNFSEEINDCTIKPGHNNFTFNLPFSMDVEAVVFDGNYIVGSLFAGNKILLGGGNNRCGGNNHFRSTDFFGNQFPLNEVIQSGLAFSFSIWGQNDESVLKGKIVGKRIPKSERHEAIRTGASSLVRKMINYAEIGTPLVDSYDTIKRIVIPAKETKPIVTRFPYRFAGKRMVVDSGGITTFGSFFIINGVEIERVPYMSSPELLLFNHKLNLPSAGANSEIRFLIENASPVDQVFSARLWGDAVY